MRFGVFLPPQAEAQRVPVLYWLSGLTCTEEISSSRRARSAAPPSWPGARRTRHQPARPEDPGESESYDFGLGAGFYVDATQAPWSRGYACVRT